MTRLKFERLRRGLSQGAVGAIVRITQPDMGLIETGRLIPTPAQLQRLATLLNVPADVLLQSVEIVERPAHQTASQA